MIRPGFEEQQAPYAAEFDPQSLVGQVRNLGDLGPAYEVMEVSADGSVLVEIIYSEERITFPLQEVLADPMATTVP